MRPIHADRAALQTVLSIPGHRLLLSQRRDLQAALLEITGLKPAVGYVCLEFSRPIAPCAPLYLVLFSLLPWIAQGLRDTRRLSLPAGSIETFLIKKAFPKNRQRLRLRDYFN